MPSLATAASSTSLHRQWKTWFAVTGYSRGAKPVIVAVQRSVQTAAVILPPVSWLLGLRVLQALAVPSSVSFGRTAPSVELRLVIVMWQSTALETPVSVPRITTGAMEHPATRTQAIAKLDGALLSKHSV